MKKATEVSTTTQPVSFDQAFKDAKITGAELEKFKQLDQKATAGITAAAESGKVIHEMHDLLVKKGSKSLFGAWLRSRGIVRQTAYRHMAEHVWSVVPAELRELARADADNQAVRDLIAKQHEAEQANPEKKADREILKVAIAEKVATDEKVKVDPIKAAVEKAATLLIAACKGQLEKIADLVKYEETFATAQSTMELTATNIMAASQLIAQKAFEEVRSLTQKKAELYKGLKLPEQGMITNPAAVQKQIEAISKA